MGVRLKSDAHPGDDLVRKSLAELEQYILSEDFAGYDPYDLLTSPVFSLPGFRANKSVRLTAQQIFRRLPLNLRPLLQIPKGHNPVTYGLCLQAFTYLPSVFPEREEIYRREADHCIEELQRLQSRGYSGACWGYDFDWEARYARLPAYTPTIIATGMIANALFVHYSRTGDKRAFDLCKSSASFVLHDLKRIYDGDTLCFSYSPADTQQVINATMKAARLLAQVYSVTGENSLLDHARGTVRYVLRRQRPDGAWPYSMGDSRSWVDNFHTGYVLDCLQDYSQHADDHEVSEAIRNGIVYYKEHFFLDGGIPKYYNNAVYPLDASAAAQSILTLVKFGFHSTAETIALWMISNMQDPSGFFYYQKHRHYTNRISYMRWSNAWMFAALSFLLGSKNALV